MSITSPSPAATTAATPTISDVVDASAELAGQLGREDLVRSLRTASARVHRPGAVICVVGEFKQGKSSLVNALVGRRVCPVADDLATSAITLVHSAAEPAVTVRRIGDQGPITEAVAHDRLAEWVTEAGNPDNLRRVERVEVGLPGTVLDRGFSLVDTPGVGGLSSGHAAATRAFLPFADGLLFVSDASAELSGPEMEFLRTAREASPQILLVLSKIDLHPRWRQIADLNAGHLARAGIDIPILPVSSLLRALAVRQGDTSLAVASGFGDLITAIERSLLADVRASATRRAVNETRSVLGQLRASARTEAETMRNPETLLATLDELERARHEVEHQRGPAARWQVALNDRWSELSNACSQQLRRDLRAVPRDAESRLADLSTAKQWDDFVAGLQAKVAEDVSATFEFLFVEAEAIRAEIVTLLHDEQPDLGLLELRADVAPERFWTSTMPALASEGGLAAKTGRHLTAVVDLMRGAQGNMMVGSFLATIIPAAGLALILANPFVLAGMGVLSAGRVLLDTRTRRIAQQRSVVLRHISRLVEDVTFEATNELTVVLRQTQAAIRDELLDRFTQVQRTVTDLMASAQANANAAEKDAAAALTRATAVDDRCDLLLAHLDRAAPGTEAA